MQCFRERRGRGIQNATVFRGAIIFVFISLLFSLVACNTSQSPSRARANTPQTVQVTVATAKKQDLPVYLSGLGSVQAFYTVSVRSRVDGQLVDVRFREGEFVKKGDLLAVIDPRPYQVQLDQAQATLFKDQASLRDARLNYQRYKDLLEQSGAMSQQQVDTQRATVDQLEGTVRNDQALVDNAKLNLTYCHITAPESGRIGLRLVDPGNIVHASDTNPLLVITQLQPITAIFSLPADQIITVARRMRRGPLEVDAYSRDDTIRLAAGKLLSIDNQIDQTTGTGRLKAVFENKDGELWPNQFVNVHLLLETRRGVTVVPSAAVQHGPQGNYVFVVKPDKSVDVRNVEVAISEGNLSQIASGVAPGDVVVTDGQDKLQAGSHVEPHQQTSQGQANAEAGAPGTPPEGAQTGSGYPGSGNPNASGEDTAGRRRGRAPAGSSGTASQ